MRERERCDGSELANEHKNSLLKIFKRNTKMKWMMNESKVSKNGFSYVAARNFLLFLGTGAFGYDVTSKIGISDLTILVIINLYDEFYGM